MFYNAFSFFNYIFIRYCFQRVPFLEFERHLRTTQLGGCNDNHQ
jgi:hypothetical protein